MNKDTYQELFSRLPGEKAPARLVTDIDATILRLNKGRLTRHLIISGAVSLAAVIGFVPAVRELTTVAAESGFSTYASLLVSDGVHLLSSWKFVMYSLIESFPIIDTAIVTALIVVFLYSFGLMINNFFNQRNVRSINYQHNIA